MPRVRLYLLLKGFMRGVYFAGKPERVPIPMEAVGQHLFNQTLIQVMSSHAQDMQQCGLITEQVCQDVQVRAAHAIDQLDYAIARQDNHVPYMSLRFRRYLMFRATHWQEHERHLTLQVRRTA